MPESKSCAPLSKKVPVPLLWVSALCIYQVLFTEILKVETKSLEVKLISVHFFNSRIKDRQLNPRAAISTQLVRNHCLYCSL